MAALRVERGACPVMPSGAALYEAVAGPAQAPARGAHLNAMTPGACPATVAEHRITVFKVPEGANANPRRSAPSHVFV